MSFLVLSPESGDVRAQAKKELVKDPEPKKDEPKTAEPKKDPAKKDEPKKDAPVEEKFDQSLLNVGIDTPDKKK